MDMFLVLLHSDLLKQGQNYPQIRKSDHFASVIEEKSQKPCVAENCWLLDVIIGLVTVEMINRCHSALWHRAAMYYAEYKSSIQVTLPPSSLSWY